MNRRQFFTAIAAAGSMTAASEARLTLAYRPLPSTGESRANSQGGGKSKAKSRHRKHRGNGK